jgi:hypothetical protein
VPYEAPGIAIIKTTTGGKLFAGVDFKQMKRHLHNSKQLEAMVEAVLNMPLPWKNGEELKEAILSRYDEILSEVSKPTIKGYRFESDGSLVFDLSNGEVLREPAFSIKYSEGKSFGAAPRWELSFDLRDFPDDVVGRDYIHIREGEYGWTPFIISTIRLKYKQ